MNHILGVKLGTMEIAGHHIYVKQMFAIFKWLAHWTPTNKCLLQSLWCGENRRIILQIATFV
jgi:hypothetical protein